MEMPKLKSSERSQRNDATVNKEKGMKKTTSFLTLVALIGATGTAFAGSTVVGGTATSTPVTYANETFLALGPYTLPGGLTATVNRTLGTIALPGGGAPNGGDTPNSVPPQAAVPAGTVFDTVIALPFGGQLGNLVGLTAAQVQTLFTIPTALGAGCGAITGPFFVSANAVSARVRYRTAGPYPCSVVGGTIRFTPAPGAQPPLNYTDNVNLLAAPGGSASVQMQTVDANSVLLDGGDDTKVYVNTALASGASVTATTAIIDVTTPTLKTGFTFPDALLTDSGGGIVFTNKAAATTPLDRLTGAAWDPNGAGVKGFYTAVISGDFSATSGVTTTAATSPRLGGAVRCTVNAGLTTCTWTLSSANSSLFSTGALTSIEIFVNGTTVLTPRSYSVSSVTYTDAATATVRNTAIGTATTLTTWSYNASVVFAPFLNGNMAQFRSRVYVCNRFSGAATGVSVNLYKQPVTGSSGTPLNAAVINTTEPLAQGGCLNIRLEDLMTAGGLGSTYTADGGNLAAEITVLAPGIFAVANVINIAPSAGTTTSPVAGPESVATYPLFVIQ